MQDYSYILALIICSLFLCQCKPETPVPDSVDIQIRRFEQALFALDTANTDLPFEAQVAALQREYPNFWPVFKQMIANPYALDDNFAAQVRDFITHPGVRSLYDTTQIMYKDISEVEAELGTALSYFKHYFPERPVPEVVSYVSEFSTGTFTYGDSLIGIGWEFYLGQDFPYDYSVFPQFLQESMDKEHLTAKAIEALASNIVGARDKGQRLLDFMIDNGKILYIKSLLLPDASHEVLLDWKAEKLAWMENEVNERELWRQILTRKMLYSTRQSDYQKLITASPSGTTWMPPESPGKAANWIGWQIVKAYMERHPETSLEELVALKDAQQILDVSKYRPSRR